MSDQTILGISEELRQFIEALVVGVVLEEETFENHKKYLQRFCKGESIDYNQLENNLSDLFDTALELETHESKASERFLRLLGKECYLFDDNMENIISAINKKRRAEEDARRKRKAREEAERKAKVEAECKAREDVEKVWEADEDDDDDPKKFILQLTDKLSQYLTSYNCEDGNDEGLSKYVGKMIGKAAEKVFDEDGKKELMEKLKKLMPSWYNKGLSK